MYRATLRKLRLPLLVGVGATLMGCVTGPAGPGAVLITEKSDQKPTVVALGTTIRVRLSKMRWTEIHASDQETPTPVLQLTARPMPGEDGKAEATFVAAHPGKVTLMAYGRAKCSPGQACPHFLEQWSRTIEITGAAR